MQIASIIFCSIVFSLCFSFSVVLNWRKGHKTARSVILPGGRWMRKIQNFRSCEQKKNGTLDYSSLSVLELRSLSWRYLNQPILILSARIDLGASPEEAFLERYLLLVFWFLISALLRVGKLGSNLEQEEACKGLWP